MEPKTKRIALATLLRARIGDGPFSNYMAVFAMPNMATWERVLTEEAPKRIAEELKRWNEMTTNYSITIMHQVL